MIIIFNLRLMKAFSFAERLGDRGLPLSMKFSTAVLMLASSALIADSGMYWYLSFRIFFCQGISHNMCMLV